MSLGLYGKGMHFFILEEMEVGTRVAMAQDSENCGWSALDDLSYEQYERSLARQDVGEGTGLGDDDVGPHEGA